MERNTFDYYLSDSIINSTLATVIHYSTNCKTNGREMNLNFDVVT